MKKCKKNVLRFAGVLCVLSFGLFLKFDGSPVQAATSSENVIREQEVIDGIEWLAEEYPEGSVFVQPVEQSQIGEEVTIPEYVGDLHVTTIYPMAFEDCDGLKTVHMPDSITGIGFSAFSGCSELTYINLSKNLRVIDTKAFASCKLQSISIPEGVTVIPEYAFTGCKNLESVYLPPSIKTIKTCAFENCAILSITIPQSTTSIDISALEGCSYLEFIDVNPYNDTYSSENGVLFNKDQTELLLCPMTLKNVYTIPDSVTSLHNFAFKNCKQLTEIIFPDGLKDIGDNTFYGCSGLVRMELNKNLTEFKLSMIAGCKNICEFEVDSENETYCSVDGILYNKKEQSTIICPASYRGAVVLPSWVKTVGEGFFSNHPLITKITFPDSVTTIYSNFQNCYSLESVQFGKGLVKLNSKAFTQCYSLTRIDVDEENEKYCSVDGILFSKDMKTLLRFPSNSADTYTIPATVETIGDYSFNDCYNLRTLNFTDGVKIIEGSACSGYTNLTKYYLPRSLQKACISGIFTNDSLYTVTVTDGKPVISPLKGINKSTSAYYDGTKKSFTECLYYTHPLLYNTRPDSIFYLEPSIVTQPVSAVYQEGNPAVKKLTVSAVPGYDKSGNYAGELSYQWYVASDNELQTNRPITGATDPSYLPSTKMPRTQYYTCVVTNTLDGYTSTISSEPAKIEVIENEETPVESTDLTGEVKMNSEWENGYTGEIILTNNTDQTIRKWNVSFDTPDTIENIWGGVLNTEIDCYIVTNENYNKTIFPGQSISIGFTAKKSEAVASGPANVVVRSFK